MWQCQLHIYLYIIRNTEIKESCQMHILVFAMIKIWAQTYGLDLWLWFLRWSLRPAQTQSGSQPGYGRCSPGHWSGLQPPETEQHRLGWPWRKDQTLHYYSAQTVTSMVKAAGLQSYLSPGFALHCLFLNEVALHSFASVALWRFPCQSAGSPRHITDLKVSWRSGQVCGSTKQ